MQLYPRCGWELGPWHHRTCSRMSFSQLRGASLQADFTQPCGLRLWLRLKRFGAGCCLNGNRASACGLITRPSSTGSENGFLPQSQAARRMQTYGTNSADGHAAVRDDLFQVVCKARSHQNPGPVEQWALRGDNFADKMTNDVVQAMPPGLRNLLAAKAIEHSKLAGLRQAFHSHMHAVGARTIASKSSAQPRAATDDQQEMLDFQSSVGPLPATLEMVRLPGNLAQHGAQILGWLKQRQSGANRHDHWLSSYRLFGFFQAVTRDIGVRYGTKLRKYVKFVDCVSGAYSFVRGASWFSGLVKCVCKHIGVPCVVEDKAPASITLPGWHRCVLMRVSAEFISFMDQLFAGARVRNVKKINAAFATVDGYWPEA